ncbi:enoyl-CoA hydratase/isomerase family protein [Persicobacter psychrovividus]|uniref:Enoyl-CoA hydratase n=1 Tax=Persicobacter psychrovividus TaxID=387638 RepID=A0ABM7VAK8_9BACT|nr:enoyl-CoA hydratase [Persicobacter psychrovividus]
MFKSIEFAVEDHVLLLTINKPEKYNVLDLQTLEELREAIQQGYDDEEVLGMIITGAGEKSFSAGVDINEIKTLNELNGRKYSETGQEVFALIEDCHKPVIAAVNGFALGGGCELAMACHIRVATENARFGLPEVNLGLIPGFGGTQRMAHIVGRGKAIELMLTGDHVPAAEGKALGLVNHVVYSHEELMTKAREIMSKIINKAPLAIGSVISCVNAASKGTDAGYQSEANNFSNLCKSSDFKEGVNAFLEKRNPEFLGE